MFTRRWVLAVMMFAGLGWTFQPASAAAEHSGKGAQQFIESLAGDAIAALTSDADRAQRIDRFRILLNHNFDVPLIGKWVMGRYWRAATDVEKEEYLNLFEDLIVITYVDRFDQYSGEKLDVLRTIQDPGKDALVYSEIKRPKGGEAVRVNWRVRDQTDQFRIIDVYVEGMSMGQTQRSEFASVIRSNGGTVEGLLKVLREKVTGLQEPSAN